MPIFGILLLAGLGVAIWKSSKKAENKKLTPLDARFWEGREDKRPRGIAI